MYALRMFMPGIPLQDQLNNGFLSAIDNASRIIRIATPNLNAPCYIAALARFINERNGVVELIMSKNFNDQREKYYGGTNDYAVELLMNAVQPDKRERLRIRWYSHMARYRLKVQALTYYT